MYLIKTSPTRNVFNKNLMIKRSRKSHIISKGNE